MYQDHIVIDYSHWDRDYFKMLQASGINAVHATLVYHEDARQTMTRFSEWHTRFEQNSDLILPVYSVKQQKSRARSAFSLARKTAHQSMMKLA